MCLTIIAKFFVCNLLAFCNNFIEIGLRLSDNDSPESFTTATEIGNFLVILGSSTTPLIFVQFYPKYRRNLLRLLCLNRCCGAKTPRKEDELVIIARNQTLRNQALKQHNANNINNNTNEVCSLKQNASASSILSTTLDRNGELKEGSKGDCLKMNLLVHL
jgi:hypothetical protein